MRVLVVGSGAREHALLWHLAASPLVTALMAAPGNAGMAAIAPCHAVGIEDVAGLVALAKDQAVDFVVVGPEAPLTLGLVDALAQAGIDAFGPNAAAARLEGSKVFMKDLCAAHGIPTAGFGAFEAAAPAKACAARLSQASGGPVVIKADGLAAGKGVVVAADLPTAEAAIDELLDPKLGGRVVVEEFLAGEEVSFFALCDGTNALPLIAAQDHKRAFDGDEGPNTGGMGAYSPAPVFTPAIEARVMAEIIRPTLAAMAQAGAPFRGVLFAGLMIAPDGTPRLLEFNVRFGDPETQVLMLRLADDLLPALIACARGGLDRITLRWHDASALVVVMAAEGYPGAPRLGTAIHVPATMPEGALIFHAGTARDADGSLIAKGGRVLSVAARAATIADARALAYGVIDRIDWPQGFCRRDIGWRALGRG